MTDREMLELAAKAAGLDDAEWRDMNGWAEVRDGEIQHLNPSHVMWSHKLRESTGCGYWAPLHDNDDAFRLMVDLKLDCHFEEQERLGDEFEVIEIFGPRRDDGSQHCEAHALGDDPIAATRRAIVMAAAEIGRLT